MKIPQHKIDEIASSVDIVDIISAYTPLRKAGRSFMGRCPFHEEKTPSFSVSQEKGVYHCFGCGKSGNVFTFVMDTENVSFFEAAKVLAEKANIKIDFEDEPYDSDRNLVDKIIEIHKRAARYFYDNLMGRDGEYAREYLRQRGTKEDMITRFGLGYSLRDKEALFQELSKEFTQEELRESGLFLVLAQNEFRDRFRGRLMFPIISESNRVVGFGGRKLQESEGYDEAKYVNSPETKIYNKSRILYGLNASKNRIKETGYAILVEGYMDLISLFQNGFENVVASSGTSLTGLQVKILSRYTQEVVVVFDADLAGQNASMRAIEMIIEFNMNVNVVVLPFGDDPDTFVRKNGPEAFERFLTKRQSIINYIGEQYKESGKMDSPEGKTEFVRRIINLIAKMRDAIKRDFYIKDIASRFSIYESIIRKELDNQLKLNRKGITKEYRPENKIAKAEETEFAIEKVMLQERVLLYLLINADKKVREFIRDNIELDFFQNEQIIRIVNRIMQLLESGEEYNFNKLINSFDSLHITQILSNLEFDKELEFLGSLKGHDALLKAASNAINDLKLEQYDRKINKLLKELELRMNNSTDYEEISLQIKKTVSERDSLTHRRVSKK